MAGGRVPAFDPAHLFSAIWTMPRGKEFWVGILNSTSIAAFPEKIVFQLVTFYGFRPVAAYGFRIEPQFTRGPASAVPFFFEGPDIFDVSFR